MIIRNASEPQKSLYVIGANILSVLMRLDDNSIDPIVLFDIFNASGCSDNKISITYFNFALDWLYLMNAIELDLFGDIRLCK